jgi:hypothetical protein
MNIRLIFSDNTKNIVAVKPKQKICILSEFIFKKYLNFKNKNAITYNYTSINDKTRQLSNNILDKNKTFQSQKITKNSTIHVNIDMNLIFIEKKKEAIVDKLVSNENITANTRNTNTNLEIINKLNAMGFTNMDNETINAIIDNCKSQKNVSQVSIEDILEFLT